MNAPLSRIRGGVHASVKHDSAAGHTNGQALYLDDIPAVPGTLETALVLSPHPHARIVSIDLSAALAADGVAGGRHRCRYSRQERHRADPHRRTAAGRRSGRA